VWINFGNRARDRLEDWVTRGFADLSAVGVLVTKGYAKQMTGKNIATVDP